MGLLELLIVLLLVGWLLGVFIVPVGSSAIHLLLAIVCVLIIVRILQGRDVV